MLRLEDRVQAGKTVCTVQAGKSVPVRPCEGMRERVDAGDSETLAVLEQARPC